MLKHIFDRKIGVILFLSLGAFSLQCGPAVVNPYVDEPKLFSLKLPGRIAYTIFEPAGRQSIYLIDFTTSKVLFVRSGADQSYVSWSPDGTKIAFGASRILIASPTMSQLDSVVFYTHATVGYPAWTHDGRLSYWYRAQDGGSGTIWVDGRVYFDKAKCYPTRPAWSPDGRYLVVSIKDSTSDAALYRVDLTDFSMKPLLWGYREFRGTIMHSPIFSPDGKWIAFEMVNQYDLGKHQIWIIDVDGKQRGIFSDGLDDMHPAWSPDGEKIAFARNGDVHNVDLKARTISRVTTHKSSGFPAWTR